MSNQSLLWLFVSGSLLLFWVTGTSLAMRPRDQSRDPKVIYPGRGVAGAWIGEAPSGEFRCGGQNRVKINIHCDEKKIITEIRITDGSFYVEKVDVRVGKSRLDDVTQYYGIGKQTVERDGTTLEYLSQGIKFKTDSSRERIAEITIFNPFQSIDKGLIEQLKKKK